MHFRAYEANNKHSKGSGLGKWKAEGSPPLMSGLSFCRKPPRPYSLPHCLNSVRSHSPSSQWLCPTHCEILVLAVSAAVGSQILALVPPVHCWQWSLAALSPARAFSTQKITVKWTTDLVISKQTCLLILPGKEIPSVWAGCESTALLRKMWHNMASSA